jgi:hypothetical protein
MAMTAENETSPQSATHADQAVEPAPETATGPVEGTTSHDIPLPAGLAKAMAENWDPAPPMPHPASRAGTPSQGAATFARNRAALSAAFGGHRPGRPRSGPTTPTTPSGPGRDSPG